MFLLPSFSFQVSPDEITTLVELLRRRDDAPRRFPELVALVNRLADAYAEVSPIESEELRTFNPETLANIDVDREWFLAQVSGATINMHTLSASFFHRDPLQLYCIF